jgi:ABC-type branched-subunit amino acid transport system substrate-binding protein
VAGGPILRRGNVAMVSGSATRASLTDPITPDGRVLRKQDAAGKILAPVYFRRVIPTDKFQGATDAAFVLKKMGVKSGDTVMTVDQAEAYSVPLIALISGILDKAGVKVDHESQSDKQTDFTALSNKAKAEGAKVVVFGSQVASNAQLFFQQLKSRGYTADSSAPTDLRLDEVHGAGRLHLVVQPRHPRRSIAKPYRCLREAVRPDELVRGPLVGRGADDRDGDLGLLCRWQDEPRRGPPRHRQRQAEDLAARQADRVRQVR